MRRPVIRSPYQCKLIFSEEYNEDINFDTAGMTGWYNCGMMLNGDFYIFRHLDVSTTDNGVHCGNTLR